MKRSCTADRHAVSSAQNRREAEAEARRGRGRGAPISGSECRSETGRSYSDTAADS